MREKMEKKTFTLQVKKKTYKLKGWRLKVPLNELFSDCLLILNSALRLKRKLHPVASSSTEP